MQAMSLPTVSGVRRKQMVQVLVGLNILAYFAGLLSVHWDVSQHAKGVVDGNNFWYPPHYGIYLSLFVAALVSVTGFVLALSTPGSLFAKLRAAPALVVLTIANVIGVTGAPFDAWWHETFGIDLTTWSPPHLHLIIGSTLVLISCAVYFLDTQPADSEVRFLGLPQRRELILAACLAVGMLMGSTGFLDYESPVNPNVTGPTAALIEIMARPLWSYPVTWTAFSLFLLTITAAASRRVGLATLVAVIYTIVRLGLILMTRTMFDYQGVPFYPLLIPAIALDLALAAGLKFGRGARWPLVVAASLLATVSMIITVPMIWSRHLVHNVLNVAPWGNHWLLIGAVGVVFGAAGWWVGSWMRRIRPDAA